MRALALALCVAFPAHAELYRWIEPETGRVKFSTVPPYDPRVKAEVIQQRLPAPPKTPAEATGTKPKPPAAPAGSADAPPAAAGSVGVLEGRLRELTSRLTGAKPQDFDRGAEGLRQHMEAYDAVRAELDRLDPKGAERRKRESESMVDRLKQAFGERLGSGLPGILGK